jgi:hypothetical protein
MNKHLDQLECDKLLKLYIDVYAHVPTNEDYLAIFLHGWLVERNGFLINWAQYVYDTTQEQMKSSFSLKGNCSTTSYSKKMNQSEGGLELSDNEDYVVLEGLQKLNVFLSNQVAVVKEILEEARSPNYQQDLEDLLYNPRRRNWKMKPSNFV